MLEKQCKFLDLLGETLMLKLLPLNKNKQTV